MSTLENPVLKESQLISSEVDGAAAATLTTAPIDHVDNVSPLVDGAAVQRTEPTAVFKYDDGEGADNNPQQNEETKENKIHSFQAFVELGWRRFVRSKREIFSDWDEQVSDHLTEDHVIDSVAAYHIEQAVRYSEDDEIKYDWVYKTAMDWIHKGPLRVRVTLWNFKRNLRDEKDALTIQTNLEYFLSKYATLRKVKQKGEFLESDVHMLWNLFDSICTMYEYSPLLRSKVAAEQYQKIQKERKFKQRRMLLAAGGTAAVGAVVWAGANSEVRSAVKAIMARPEPKIPEDGYDQFQSMFAREKYEKYCKNKDIISEEHFKNIVYSASRIVKNYWVQYETPPADIYHYLEEFLDNLQQRAEAVGYDFNLYLLLLIPIAENTTLEPYHWGNMQEEVKIGRAQLALDAVESLFPLNGRATNLLATRRGFLGRLMKALHSRTPISYLEIIRMAGPITFGLDDLEAKTYAQGIKQLSEEKQKEFAQKYPDVAESFDVVIKESELFEGKRSELKALADQYAQKYAGRLMPFFTQPDHYQKKDHPHWAAIGVSRSGVDAWHKVNPTMTWNYLHGYGGGLDDFSLEEENELLLRETIAGYEGMVDFNEVEYNQEKNDVVRVHQLLSQQILNPKFLPFLLEQAQSSEERKLVEQMMAKHDEYLERARSYNAAENFATAAAGALELDLEFQTDLAVPAFQFFSSKVEEHLGKWDTNTQSGLAFKLFCTIAVWEFTSKFSVSQGSVFARYTKVDPIYDFASVLGEIKFVSELAYLDGFLRKPPQEDFSAFFKLLRQLKDAVDCPIPGKENIWSKLTFAVNERLCPAPYCSINRAMETTGWYLETSDYVNQNQVEEEQVPYGVPQPGQNQPNYMEEGKGG